VAALLTVKLSNPMQVMNLKNRSDFLFTFLFTFLFMRIKKRAMWVVITFEGTGVVYLPDIKSNTISNCYRAIDKNQLLINIKNLT